jgi:adenine-specific DNA-methyltransferase
VLNAFAAAIANAPVHHRILKRPDGGNVLTSSVLTSLAKHDGPKVVYGEGCRLSAARLKREGVVFKQVPYGIKVT